MRISTSVLAAAFLSVAPLAACGGGGNEFYSSTPAPVPLQTRQLLSSGDGAAYKVLFSFNGAAGRHPRAGLIGINGTLYGTTAKGGTNCDAHGFGGCGTVFKISTSGTESVLYSFGSNAYDSGYPYAGLLGLNGTLYGTTYGGGSSGHGSVFKITTSGTGYQSLYSFKGAPDGAEPVAGLTDVKGTLYGTTENGGSECDSNGGCGSVFTVSRSGTESVLYNFKGGADGSTPQAGLLNVNGTLYGTTLHGGGAGCESSGGCGTVFTVGTSGAESVLYSFKGGTDGAYPQAALVDVNGTLYGTTANGGTGCHSSSGCGIVFTLSTSGAESVLYSFKGGKDGSTPRGGLTGLKGALYGSTSYGGSKDRGTLFAIATSGAETVLHSFGGPADGQTPLAGLVSVNGKLYGTTYEGGAFGVGTVFALSP